MENKSMIKESLEIKKPTNLKVFGTIDTRYRDLLVKFCENNELTELIKECILDLEKSKEVSYMQDGKYPEKRNPLMKLLYDLEQTNIIVKKQKEETNG